MKYRIIKLFSVFLSIVVILLCFPLSGSANSAPRYWNGVTASGIFITEGECPLIVENEILTLELIEFPENDYTNAESFLQYNGKVTAEYYFYNPTDYTVNTTLVFPYGNLPDYSYIYDSSGKHIPIIDTDKYDITVNGTHIDKTTRYTYSNSTWYEFSIEDGLNSLSDGYIDDELLTFETPVTLYSYTLNCKESNPKNVRITATFECDNTKTIFYVKSRYGGFSFSEDKGKISIGADDDGTIEVYFIGEAPDGDFDWQLTRFNGDEVDGEVIFNKDKIQKMTFEEYVFANYNSDSGIMRHDWYNAALCYFKDDYKANERGYFDTSFTKHLMRWYEYELTLEPGERIVNCVTAPIYPDIDGEYEPEIYTYTYLLSPASKWASFGKLNINVNTPYYLIDSELSFTKTEEGYTLSLDGLPENELVFTLSESESPEERKSIFGFLWVAYFLLFQFCGPIPFFALLIFCGGFITLIVVLIKKRRRKAKSNTNS